MSCNHIDFIGFNFAAQVYRLFLTTTPSRNCVAIPCTVSASTSNPAAICSFDKFRPMKYKPSTQTCKRLVMTFKVYFRQIIKLPSTGAALIPLTGCLVSVKSSFGNLSRITHRTTNTFKPPQLAGEYRRIRQNAPAG
jgi:hypothetical protein